MFRAFQASWLITGAADADALADGAVVVDDKGTVVAVGAAAALRAAFPFAHWLALRGVVMPGLVNAHVRLEHALASGRVTGGRGFVPAFEELSSRFSPWDALEQDDRPVRDAVIDAARLGTAAVGDVTASGVTLPILLRGRMAAHVFREVGGMTEDAAQLVESFAREQLSEFSAEEIKRVSLVPHSLLGTHRIAVESLAREARERGALFALPVASSAAERAFLLSKTGPFADFARARGFDVGDAAPMGLAGVDAAASLGALSDGTLAADLADATRDEIAALGRTGAGVVITPRAALHVEVKLPDVPAMLAEGIQPALGTSSVALSGDYDVLAEAKTLRDRFPAIPPLTLLAMATSFGARALRKRTLGELSLGKTPGVLFVEGDVADDPASWILRDVKRPRTWLANPGVE